MGIDEQILKVVDDSWKSVPEIAKELNESSIHVNKRVNQLIKYDLVLCMFAEKEKNKKGKTPRVFKRKEVEE